MSNELDALFCDEVLPSLTNADGGSGSSSGSDKEDTDVDVEDDVESGIAESEVEVDDEDVLDLLYGDLEVSARSEFTESANEARMRLVLSLAEEAEAGVAEAISHLLMEIAEAPEVPDFLPSGPSATELGYEVVAIRFSEDLESWEPDHVYEVLEGEEDIIGQAHEDEGDNIFMDIGDVFDCWA
ncbi:PREDICTED: uncharacterized protein LOC101305689 [Fragaria vesca subsp. vesca]|uniref:uncharacterized protein LOC101305689 n=1 Tax=Fragaria vesca subsp. vesca TaxID=101020 RepID=UPI0002C2F55D|nr:PREDICTED: uncharacterized protein LOC101305689 [Fragaria vesca subsp. vesca]